ncbi:hypothetical protein K439DRAFT_1620579 [Ramaria rubella]|nr:hypothetical protein K439DRAFT_1620579 [Ramaria rubella]
MQDKCSVGSYSLVLAKFSLMMLQLRMMDDDKLLGALQIAVSENQQHATDRLLQSVRVELGIPHMRPGKQRARLLDIDDDGDTDLEDGMDEAEEGLDGVKDGSQSLHTKHNPHFTEIADAAAEEDAEEALESDGILYATHTRSRKIKKELLAAFHEFIFSHITLDLKDPN